MKHFLDVESSGFNNWRNSVISLAWIITDNDYNIQAEFYDECSPDTGKLAWDIGSEVAHGFKENEMRLKQQPIELCKKLIEFWRVHKVKDASFYYHANAYFDTRMLFGLFMKNLQHEYYEMYKHVKDRGHINTIELIKNKLLGEVKNKQKQKEIKAEGFGLDGLAKRFSIDFKHHNALSDTRCLVEICKQLKV